MFKAKVISGESYSYHPQKNPTETREAFRIWFTFDGVPYSFRMSFFQADQIEKAKAAAASGVAMFGLRPNNYVAPEFYLA